MKIEINGKMYELVDSSPGTLSVCNKCAFCADDSNECAMPSNDNEDECWKPENDRKYWKEVLINH